MSTFERVFATLALVLGVSITGMPAAHADLPNCETQATDLFGAGFHASDAITIGVRAPIQLRKDGSLCISTGGHEPAFTSDWLGIQDNYGDLVQIGFIHTVLPGDSSGTFARFYSVLIDGDVTVYHNYDINDSNDTNDVYSYYRIQQYYDPMTREYLYDMADNCGGSSYSSCETRWGNQEAFTGSTESGEFEAESDYSKDCQDQMMGDNSDRVDLGKSSGGDNGSQEEGSGLTWRNNSFNGETVPTNCANYLGSVDSSHLTSYDSSNTD